MGVALAASARADDPSPPAGPVPVAPGTPSDASKETAASITTLRAQAEKGDGKAQFKLGQAYAHGNGVGKNPVEAVRWYRKAAETGNAEAEYFLGISHEFGIGVEMDVAEAMRWYRKAADHGDADAQVSLGTALRKGEGIAKDAAEAVRWFRKAAEQGNVKGEFRLGYCLSVGEGVARDADEGARWWRKAADQGDKGGQYCLGRCYLLGSGVAKDETQALVWEILAASNGVEESRALVAELESTLTPKQVEAARRLAREFVPRVEIPPPVPDASPVAPPDAPTPARSGMPEPLRKKGRDLVRSFDADVAKADEHYSTATAARASGDRALAKKELDAAYALLVALRDKWDDFVGSVPTDGNEDVEDVLRRALPAEVDAVTKIVRRLAKVKAESR